MEKNKENNIKIIIVIIAAIFIVGILSISEIYRKYRSQKQLVQNEYNKALYETVGYVKNVESELAKFQVTSTKELQVTTLASIWKQSNLAKDNFEALPFEESSQDNTSKYLTQLSDYSYFLMKQVISNESITDENYENISNLYTDCKNLSLVMSNIYNDLNAGNIKWDELEQKGNEELKQTKISDTISSFAQIGKTFQQYEGLIYDGAFSDHILNSKAKSLPDKECTQEEAEEYIKNIFGEEKIESIDFRGESNGRIDLYLFDVKLKSSQITRSLSITKKGCKLYLMISDRNVEKENIVMQSAIDKGMEFLKKVGIDNMQETYYLKTDNMVIINYAAKQDGVILYPDLIKIKIALDDGEICSFEAQGYTFNHTKRENITPSISIQKASEVVSSRVKVTSQSVAIIPTESQNEVLCYEFKGNIEDRDVLVYINANTGKEEKILLILETPGGTLTL